MQNRIVKLSGKAKILSSASVAGKKEAEGPLGSYFDYTDTTDRFDAPTWEKSEEAMQKKALTFALNKSGLYEHDIDALFAGDLLNQCTGSTYGLIDFDIPFFGLYGACSTAVEGLILSSLLIESGLYKNVAAVTSSHFYSSERQYRFPIEYGGQRAPTAQWTVTASGAFIIGDGESDIAITEVMPGRVIDKGINDANNMGAAMAPAAIETLANYFSDSDMTPDDFDLIVTGDLAYEGSRIVSEFMQEHGFTSKTHYNDCGLMIFDRNTQDVHAGGSGCGCSASVIASYIIPEMRNGKYRHVLAIGTGALMSPLSTLQGDNIPGIGHLIHIERM